MVYLAKAAERDVTPKAPMIRAVGSMFVFSYTFMAVVGQPASFSGFFRVFLFSTLMILHLVLQ
jgi:hypothetical protein